MKQKAWGSKNLQLNLGKMSLDMNNSAPKLIFIIQELKRREKISLGKYLLSVIQIIYFQTENFGFTFVTFHFENRNSTCIKILLK